MTTPQVLISRYNKFNGQKISATDLKAFHNDVQQCLDHDGHGPLAKELKGILERSSKALKLGHEEMKVKLQPIAINKRKKKKPAKKITRIEITGADPDLLHGLENVQDDKHLASKSLDGINDTTYKVITDRILELIKAGGLIWRQPWNDKVNGDTDLAHNYVTKHIYRGGNYYLNYLRIGFKVKGKLIKFDSPHFFTFKQVDQLGGRVREGEKGWPVIYFKWLYKDINANTLVPEEIAVSNGKLRDGYEKIPGLFYYNVFNAEQCTGLKITTNKAKKRTVGERIESAERIIAEMPKRPIIKVMGKDAWYKRQIDTVQVPPITQFKQEQHFYSVQFHELIHSTGHPDRVFREREATRQFGDKNYAFEELIAELGSSFLCGESGIFYFTMKNSAAYIANWSEALRKEMEADPKFFLRAASQAQKAADFILAQGEWDKLKKKKSGVKKSVNRPPVTKRNKVAESSKAKRASKSLLPPAERSARSKASRKISKINPTELDGLPISEKPAEAKAGLPTSNLPSGLKGFEDLKNLPHEELILDEPYKSDFIKMYNDTQIMLWGMPGSGKSVKALKFAQYLAEKKGKKVLYVAREEYGRSTMTIKINEHNIGHPNLKVVRDLNQLKKEGGVIEDFDAVFFDSINVLGMALKEYQEFVAAHPGRIYLPIVQSNKDGSFRGGNDWEHEVDIAGEVIDYELALSKNRYDPKFKEKAEKLHIESEVREKKKKTIINEKVKKELAPEVKPQPEPVTI
jgi:antirestriction protein ArdC